MFGQEHMQMTEWTKGRIRLTQSMQDIDFVTLIVKVGNEENEMLSPHKRSRA
jgi:hypothetical protein